MTHTRRTALQLITAAVAATLAAPARAELAAPDKADVARAEQYLNGITTMKARFIQIGPKGEIAEGLFYLARPGKLRFEYDPPAPALVVADGIRLVFYDRELDQVTAWPVGATPLAPLLARTVDFTANGFAQSVARDPGVLRVTLIDPGRPREGSLTLVFQDKPLELRQWVVLDAQGLNTVVALSDTQINPPLEAGLFVFSDDTHSGMKRN